MTRRVLVLTYFFPPMGGVGVQRTLKFVEHLPALGWEPVVVAPRGAVYRVMDPGSLDTIDPDLEVHRVLCAEPASVRAVVREAVRRLDRTRNADIPSTPRPSTTATTARGPRRWLNAVWSAWVRTFFIPDEQMGWIPLAARAAAAIHRQRSLDVIYSSSPPASTHLAAGLAKAMTGLPWVADLRDPWVGNAFAPPRSARRERLERWLESWVIRHADRVVFATPGLRARYVDRYPSRARRFVTITNGYDPAEVGMPSAGSDRADGRFRLVYAGSVYGSRELRTFLDGLGLAVGRRPDLRERLRVEFVGWMTADNRQLALTRAEQLEPILRIDGFVPRDEALARVRSADASLLLLSDGPDRDLFVGAKLFESIGLNRQVLAMAPPGDARAILSELDWGVVAEPRAESVAAALLTIVDAPAESRLADPQGRYDRRRLAAVLAGALDDVARSTGGSS
jgi:glycosyltransferase involved in cell wall biosynthesis